MNEQPAPSNLKRRSILALLITGAGALIWRYMPGASKGPMAVVAPFVRVQENWNAALFYDFLKHLPSEAMLSLKKGLELVKADADVSVLKGPDQDTWDIQQQALWLSSNIFTYPFRSATNLNYHELTAWVGSEAGIAKATLETAHTFGIEHELYKVLFVQMWDRLTHKQREDVLAKADPTGAIKDKASVAALTGAGALAVLSTTVSFMGFAFYTTMSATICAVAAAVGVTLPFTAYLGSSTLVATLSGPVGWAIMGAAALGGLVFAGRANVKKTAALIGQVHALKIEALVAAHVPESEIFDAEGK